MTNVETTLLVIVLAQSVALLTWFVDFLAKRRLSKLIEMATQDAGNTDPDEQSETTPHLLSLGGPSGQLSVKVQMASTAQPDTGAMMDHLARLREQMYRSQVETEIANLEQTLEVPRSERWSAK